MLRINEQSELIVMMGAHGSGKSTILERMISDYGEGSFSERYELVNPMVSPMDCVNELWKKELEAIARTNRIIAFGGCVVVDLPLVRTRQAMPYLGIAMSHDVITDLIVIRSPVERCIQRSIQRVAPRDVKRTKALVSRQVRDLDEFLWGWRKSGVKDMVSDTVKVTVWDN